MVLTFALVGLGSWFVIRTLREVIEAPRWFYMMMAIAAGCLGCWWAGESPLWGPVAAGFAHGWHRVDQVAQHLRDWVKVSAVLGRNRR